MASFNIFNRDNTKRNFLFKIFKKSVIIFPAEMAAQKNAYKNIPVLKYVEN